LNKSFSSRCGDIGGGKWFADFYGYEDGEDGVGDCCDEGLEGGREE